MCGIAGYLNFERSKSASLPILKKMTDVISHRGPDGEGFYVKNNIALGHRRLSIIDLSTGDQPMYNEDKTITLVFNGEIYNYIELRKELQNLGYLFHTTSDTEVIIKAYERWGVDCLQKLNGCWAFALWDERKNQLFLSKDRIGEKPLFYSKYQNSIIFGSELKCLFEYGLPREIMSEYIEMYLVYTNIPGPYTFYKDIYKLKPGYYILVKEGQINEYQYWDLPEIDESAMVTNKNHVYEQFEELLKDSIRIRMRSDVSFGAFLSGGLDSSSVVAVMSEISKVPIQTFTMGFEHDYFDESELASQVAKKFHTEHHLNFVKPESFYDSLKKVVFHFDEPFGDSSAIPTGYVSAFARKEVKMVLTGDGGDEILSGYSSYQGVKISSIINKLPDVIRKSLPSGVNYLAKPLKGRLKYGFNRLSNVISTSNLDFNQRMIKKMVYTDYELIKKLTGPIRNSVSENDFFSDLMSKCTYKDDFYKLMYLNFKHNLPDDYLVKVDRMSMANSLEARIPFLDHRLVEFMCSVDKNVKMQGWERKSVLRRTIGRKLPSALLKAPKKGFGIPLREWFKKDEFSSILDELLNKNLPLDKEVLISIIEDNKSGIRDNGNFIWSLFVLNEQFR